MYYHFAEQNKNDTLNCCSLPFQVIVRQAIGVIKALAGNDNVKIQVMNSGGGEMILAAMTTHQGNPGIAEMGCATIATLVLRNPTHCAKIMEAHGHQVIVQAMKVHRSSEMVQVIISKKC